MLLFQDFSAKSVSIFYLKKKKSTGSFWDPQSSQTLVLGTASNPVTKMVPVGGKLWCGSQNRVLIINTTTLEKEVGRKMRVCVREG